MDFLGQTPPLFWGPGNMCFWMYVRLGMMHVQEEDALFYFFSFLGIVINHKILGVIGHLLLHIENS